MGRGELFGSYFYRLPWCSSKVWWTIMQVLLQLVCVIFFFFFLSSPASVSGSPGGGFLSPPHPLWLPSPRLSMPARLLFGGHLLDVVAEQLVLLCGGERKGHWEGAKASQPGRQAPSLQDPAKGVRIPPGSPLPSSKLPMVACFFRKSLQSFLFRPNASML